MDGPVHPHMHRSVHSIQTTSGLQSLTLITLTHFVFVPKEKESEINRMDVEWFSVSYRCVMKGENQVVKGAVMGSYQCCANRHIVQLCELAHAGD